MSVAKAINISDLRRLARKRLPRMVFDYIDGAADDEVTLRRNIGRFDDYELSWNALTDVSNIDLSRRIFGFDSQLPFFISPTAMSRLFHVRDGERAVARAAHKAGTIYSASTLASVTVEEIHEIFPGPKVFQLYVWKDKALVTDILARAWDAGFRVIALTVDAPVGGNRERDPRNGFSVPPKVNWQTATQALARPGYLWDLATTPMIGPENFPPTGETGTISQLIDRQFSRAVTWDYVTWLKSVWQGPVAVKGISHAADANRAVAAGADAVWVSNHGGRQLETSRPTIDVLPEVVDAVGGQVDVIFDSGVRRGTHIAKALALGATGVALGRAYLFGLAAGGEAGVTRTLEILEAELRRTMALMGCASVDDLTPEFITRPA